MPQANSKNTNISLVQNSFSSEIFESLFVSSPYPQVLCDQMGNIVFQNQCFTQSFSDRKSIDDFCIDVDSDSITTRILTKSCLNEPGLYESVLLSVDPEKIFDIRISKISDNVFHLEFSDASMKKQLERELIQKTRDLKEAFESEEKANVELKATQEMLVQSGKMAALGELSAGIAHELNQPLQGVRAYAQEIQELVLPFMKDHKDSDVAKNATREIITNVDKMAKIIKYLRSFATKSTDGYEFIQPKLILEDTFKLLENQFEKDSIKIQKDFEQKVDDIFVNPTQLEQVFINLATNARDAIQSAKRKEGLIQVSIHQKDHYVEVIFRDNGIGMDTKTKTKAFNPFFTTKEVGKGMGLGLSLSFGILNKVHGSISVKSKIGQGSEFLIRVPVDFREIN